MMDDLLGNKLENGDLVMMVDPAYHYYVLGVVHGGVTPTGRMRIADHHGAKNNTNSSNLIKIDEHFLLNTVTRRYSKEFKEGLIEMHKQLKNK